MIKYLSLIGVVLLAACDRSAAFYEKHATERAAKIRACSEGQARGRDCDNAAAAAAAQRHKDAEAAFRSGVDGK